jgi:TatD DNase family protein
MNMDACKRYPDKCYMTLGVHPYHASELYTDANGLEELAILAKSLLVERPSPLVAFGEIGLDYFYLNRASKEDQQKAFLDQLEIATQFELPLFLHIRDSYADFVSLIKPFLPRLKKPGIVHSFAGTKDEMLSLVEMGFDISIKGISFKTQDQLEMVREIPLDRLQLETDAPWCEIPTSGSVLEFLKDASPLPPSRKYSSFRSGDMVEGRNESCVIERVARFVAGLKGISLDEVADNAWKDSVSMFGLGESRI